MRARAADDAGGVDESRYERTGQVLELAVALQGSHAGLSLRELADRFDVSERTARRMLGAARRAFGDEAFEHEDGEDRVRRWRMRHPFVGTTVQLEAGELASIESAAAIAERDGRAAQARTLRGVLEKLRARMADRDVRRVDPDLEALVEAQGVAMRPGPHPVIDASLLDGLRHAILARRKVELFHHHEGGDGVRRHKIWPLGFLYGIRHYLVAWSPRRGGPRLYRLSRIERMRLLDEPFQPPAGFDLRRYAELSFGVYQEEPVDVVWRFAPRVAAEAREYVFHPTQQVEEADDGALLVRFRTGGRLEMAWHLFTWGPDVEVLAPASLRQELTRLLTAALRTHSKKAQPARRGAATAARSSRAR